MARTPREFTVSKDLRDLAEELVERYREGLGLDDVNLDEIYFALCTSPKPENSQAYILGNVTSALSRRVTERPYQIAFYEDTWNEWSDAKKHRMLLWALYHISPEGEGRMRKHDVKDFYRFISTWGANWQSNDFFINTNGEREELPDPLGVKALEFDVPMPRDEDEGDTLEEGTTAPLPVDASIAAVAEQIDAQNQALQNLAKEDEDTSPS